MVDISWVLVFTHVEILDVSRTVFTLRVAVRAGEPLVGCT